MYKSEISAKTKNKNIIEAIDRQAKRIIPGYFYITNTTHWMFTINQIGGNRLWLRGLGFCHLGRWSSSSSSVQFLSLFRLLYARPFVLRLLYVRPTIACRFTDLFPGPQHHRVLHNGRHLSWFIAKDQLLGNKSGRRQLIDNRHIGQFLQLTDRRWRWQRGSHHLSFDRLGFVDPADRLF